MVKDFMDLYDKLNLLESRVTTLVADAIEAKREKENLQREYDELLEKFIAMEDEMRGMKKDREAVRQRIESIIAKLD